MDALTLIIIGGFSLITLLVMLGSIYDLPGDDDDSLL
jgi:hypothetical protein